MVNQPNVGKILDVLYESYEKEPAGYTGKVELEQKIKMPANEFMPLLEKLSKDGIVKKMEGPAPTFIVKFTEKGYDAYKRDQL